MQNSTKKILEELYEISPSLKNEEGLKSLVIFMQHHTPNVKPSKDFKKQLSKKITTIADFKQIQPKPKFNPMTFVTPIFLMIFGVFAMMQFYNYVSFDQVDVRTLPSPDSQEFVIDDILDSTESWTGGSIEDQISSEETEDIIIEDVTDELIESNSAENTIWEKETLTPQQTETFQDEVVPNSQNSEQQEANTWEENTTWEIDTLSEENQTEQNQEPLQTETFSDPEQDTNNDSFESEENNSPSWATQDSSRSAPISSEPVQSSDSEEIKQEEAPSEETNVSREQDSETQDTPKDTWASQSNTEEAQRVEWDYYTCTGSEIDYIDETDMKRIIKTYCNQNGGEFQVDEWVCKLNAKQRIWIEYIQRDLCE